MGTTQSQPDQDFVPTKQVEKIEIICSADVGPVTIHSIPAREENPVEGTKEFEVYSDTAKSNNFTPSVHLNMTNSLPAVRFKEPPQISTGPEIPVQDTEGHDMAKSNSSPPKVDFNSAPNILSILPSRNQSAIDQLLRASPARNLASVTNVPEVLLSSTIADVLRVLEGDGRPCVLVRDVPLQGSSAPPQDAIFRRIDIFHVAAALGCVEKSLLHIIEHLTPLVQVNGDASLREVRREAQSGARSRGASARTSAARRAVSQYASCLTAARRMNVLLHSHLRANLRHARAHARPPARLGVSEPEAKGLRQTPHGTLSCAHPGAHSLVRSLVCTHASQHAPKQTAHRS